jgi:hypothetical protein
VLSRGFTRFQTRNFGLASYEGKSGSVLRFVTEPVADTVFATAISAALIPAGPAIGVIAAAVLSPSLWLLAKRRFDPRSHAITSLQALL